MRRTLVLLVCSCALAGGGGGSGFPAALTHPIEGSISAGKKWSWPPPADFDQAWAKRAAAGESFAVLRGTMRAVDFDRYEVGEKKPPVVTGAVLGAKLTGKDACVGEVLMLDVHDKNGRRLEPLQSAEDPWCVRWGWEVKSEAGARLELAVGDRAVGRLAVTERIAPQAVPEEYLTDWTYAATLAQPKGKSELLEEYTKNAPMGHCSMDTAPAAFAREYAEKCWGAGDLACFLQLQVRIMGDQFRRVAYSSYGEASHPTESKRLDSTGIDVDRFFRGLQVEVPGERPIVLGPSRLARAVLESGRKDSYENVLSKMAADPRLDAFNRLRAAQTWLWLQYRADNSSLADAKKRLLAMDLTPIAREWAEQQKE